MTAEGRMVIEEGLRGGMGTSEGNPAEGSGEWEKANAGRGEEWGYGKKLR